MEHAGRAGVTVVIPHYGAPGPARALVSQILDQPTRHSLQVVVVDDCSPVAYPDDDPRVRVVRRPTNGGFGTAVNTGARLATEPLLLVLNSDLLLPPRFLDELVAAAAAHLPALVSPNVVCRGVLTGGHRFPRARFQAVERVAVLSRWERSPWWRRLVGKLPPPPPGGHAEVDWVAGEAMLLPTDAFWDVGGFDESFFMYAEEVDLQRRLHERGLASVLVGTGTVEHLGAASSDPARSAEWLLRSRLRYAQKWGGLGRLRWALSAAVLVTLLTDAVRVVAGRPSEPWGRAREDLARIWTRPGQTRPGQTRAT